MSMMGTLGKVAMGIIVAKGMSKVMGGNSSGGGLLGGLLGGQGSQRQGGGGLSDMLGGGSGGLGSLLGGASGGGLGGLLGSLAGGGAQNNAEKNNGQAKDFSSMFNDAIQGKEPEATPEQDQQAQIMLRAMISAAKADGHIDEDEKKKIVEHMKDVSDEDAEMVRNELQAPLDIQGLIESVPKGMEQQVYLMSLLAIDLDSKEEAVYLDFLAKGLNISHQESNQIHEKLGAPTLYN
ncbi:MAG: tellurite resistance TerB family protein [Cocleimonas sp.]|nr:tellurite resistance TerB family protein [Cocleimonas sp.]